MEIKIKRSPLFYVGDKYKLMPQLINLFPDRIENYYEPFVGGGTVFLNVIAKKYFLNDIDENLITIHKFLIKSAQKVEDLFKEIDTKIIEYNLSRSYKVDIIPSVLKKEFKKTYFAKFNKPAYERMRSDFNKKKGKNPLLMYLLLIYGFNRMLRFNKSGLFNVPVGNVDFNKNVVLALIEYFNTVKRRKISFENKDFEDFLLGKTYSKKDLVYVDPPYLITFSEYNKLWNEKKEKNLLKILDNLDRQGVRFALSNVTYYNGKRNEMLESWMSKYNIQKIQSNYISFNNNSKKDISEVLITNYD